MTIAVCSLDDLREMKRAAGRTRDLADLDIEVRLEIEAVLAPAGSTERSSGQRT